MQSSHQGLELLARSRFRQGDVTEMIVEIEIIVVDPDRMIELDRRHNQLTFEERNEMKPALEMVTKRRENIGICGRRIEYCQAGNVHRRFRCFAVQKAGIES